MGVAAFQQRLVTEQEYFSLLEKSDEGIEWIDGVIRLRSGISPTHATIATRVATGINSRLDLSCSCEAVVAQMQVRVEVANANYFPDVVLYCDDATFDESRPDWLLTPLLIAEVLSDSTERIDREEKLLNYRQISSLRHYLLVSQHRVLIEHYHLDENHHWISDIYTLRNQEICIDFLDTRIPVEEIYRRLNIPEGIVIVREASDSD